MAETAYHRFVARLSETKDRDRAMQEAIGGEFAAIGALECALMAQLGLAPDDYLIDVGCGSGRLAIPLSSTHRGKYLGTDIVPELVAYAAEQCQRPDWCFTVVDIITIPEADGMAEWVTFFSVLTHIRHEESYAYLAEAARVLKVGGKIVFSFLDFAVPGHWPTFQQMVRNVGIDTVPTVFIGADIIRIWARHLGLAVQQIVNGNEPWIDLPHPVQLDDGGRWEGTRPFGQSVCVLTKP